MGDSFLSLRCPDAGQLAATSNSFENEQAHIHILHANQQL